MIVKYTMEGKHFALKEPAYTPPLPPKEGEVPVPPKPVCAVGLPRFLSDAMNALRDAERAYRDYENNIVLSGDETHIVLSKEQQQTLIAIARRLQ